MKRLIVVVLLVLLLAPGASALTETKVFDNKWIPYMYEERKGGHNYSFDSPDMFLLDKDKTHLFVTRDGETIILNFDQCERTREYNVCYVNNSNKSEHSRIDYEGRLVPGVQIYVSEYSYGQDIEVTRTFSKDNFYLFEKGEVTITVKNIGDDPVTNVSVKEAVPESFQVSSSKSNVYIRDNTVYSSHDFTLYPGSEWTTIYNVQAVGSEDATYKTEVEYDSVWDQDQFEYSKSQELEVIYPFKYSYTTYGKAFDRNQKIDYLITLENNENEDIVIKTFEVNVPTGTEVISKTNILKQAGTKLYNTEFVLRPDETRKFTVALRPQKVGEYYIDHDIELGVKGMNFRRTNSSEFTVATEGIDCYYIFSHEAVTAGNLVNYTAIIKNNDDESYYNITGELEDMFGRRETFSQKTLSPGDNISIEDNELLIPFSTKEQKYNFTIEGRFRNIVQNQYFECDNYYTLVTPGAEQVIEPTVTTDKDSYDPGEEAVFDITIKNLLDAPQELVIVEHYLSNNLTSTGTARETIPRLLGNEEIHAYTFTVPIPENYSEETFTATINISIPDSTYYDSVELELEIDNPYIASVNETQPEQGEENTNKAPTIRRSKGIENQGFFAKIAYLFRSVLGKN